MTDERTWAREVGRTKPTRQNDHVDDRKRPRRENIGQEFSKTRSADETVIKIILSARDTEAANEEIFESVRVANEDDLARPIAKLAERRLQPFASLSDSVIRRREAPIACASRIEGK